MCIRDRLLIVKNNTQVLGIVTKTDIQKRILSLKLKMDNPCLLYTSDAADERSSVDLGGRRIIKKKKKIHNVGVIHETTNRTTTQAYTEI